ncbi:MAG: MFS transporter, partial [Rhodobacterales bacterium]|nr:MFS transporter [Rhodobacterales bacterium]
MEPGSKRYHSGIRATGRIRQGPPATSARSCQRRPLHRRVAPPDPTGIALLRSAKPSFWLQGRTAGELMSVDTKEEPTLFGHPTALFGLFFAEMWERFSYYGMRALLVLYMLKGFLEYGDDEAYKVYGAYAAMVYMTPFFGGMLADRLLGRRRAVILGGLLMAGGHLLMTIEAVMPFYMALAMLIVGNGFFKPNISSMVGGLYKEGDPRRDGGFTIFYIGINLGAAIAPLLCGYVGETYGWHYGFGLATFGMLVGLAVFVVPGRLARWLILSTALATAFGQVVVQDNWLLLAINAYVAIALIISGVAAFVALGRGGLSPETGAPPDMALLKKPIMGIPLEYLVYLGSFLVVPFFAVLVWSNRAVTLVPHSVTDPLMAGGKLSILAGTLLHEMSTPAGLLLMVIGSGCFLYVFYESMQSNVIERQRLWVALVMMAFSALFWAFFEQAGTSVNNFTDRNVDRVMEDSVIDNSQVGTTLTFRVMPIPSTAATAAVPGLADMPLLDQEQLGYTLKGKPFTMDQITSMRKTADFKNK